MISEHLGAGVLQDRHGGEDAARATHAGHVLLGGHALDEIFAGILAETVLAPAFPPDEVDRAREQRLAGIRQREMDPASIGNDSALPRYFAAGVPYARPVDGTTTSISGMSRDGLRGYADAAYRPGEGGLVVVGDVDASEVERMVEDQLGGWTGAPASVAGFTVEPATRERRVFIMHRPGSVQSEIRVGHVGAARSTPDYHPM